MSEFQLAADTHIGYARLRVADLNRSLGFYRDQLGLTEIRRDGDTSYLSADGSEPAIIILTEDPDAPPKPRRSTGLYHVAIRLPSRKALAETFRQLVVKQVPFSGFSDHLVSEALYLPDPDDNGLELYRDRPREEWRMSNGAVAMDTLPLDLDDLLGEAGDEPYTGID
ncbi:partial catechol 2,3-dioxygenase, partial [uncultured bacterium]